MSSSEARDRVRRSQRSDESFERDEDAQTAAIGGSMRVVLSCPRCAANVRVEWKDLRGGLCCPKCRCQFVLDRTGKTQSLKDLPHVSYACPRCKQVGSLPEVLPVKRVDCLACGLPLERGPDQRFHDQSEAERLRKETRREARLPERAAWQKFLRKHDGSLQVLNVAALAAVGMLLLTGMSLAIAHMLDDSPERRLRDFTYVCLTGEWDDATGFMPDDDVQRAEFDRWRVRYFPSILDKHRPAGDHVTIDVETISQTPELRVFAVTLQSPFLGERRHEQRWQLSDGVWQFDAVRTIRGSD